uniref:BRK domain-containing protein n=1 Tax=Ciona intestinalis TaxID=7719 RepID=H2XZB7_CIOIN
MQKSKSIRVLSKEGTNITSKEHKDRVTVICRKTMKVLRGPHAPLRRDLAKFLKAHPSYE